MWHIEVPTLEYGYVIFPYIIVSTIMLNFINKDINIILIIKVL